MSGRPNPGSGGDGAHEGRQLGGVRSRRGVPGASAPRKPWTRWTSTSGRARSTPWWARTAPARQRWPRSWPALCAPTPAHSGSSASGTPPGGARRARPPAWRMSASNSRWCGASPWRRTSSWAVPGSGRTHHNPAQHLPASRRGRVAQAPDPALGGGRGRGRSTPGRPAPKWSGSPVNWTWRFPADSLVDDLPMAVRQQAEILISLAWGARVLILDETQLGARDRWRPTPSSHCACGCATREHRSSTSRTACPNSPNWPTG